MLWLMRAGNVVFGVGISGVFGSGGVNSCYSYNRNHKVWRTKMRLNKHKNSQILNIIKIESKQMNRCLAVSFFTFKYGIHIVKKHYKPQKTHV